jgi:hypothetical protein
MAAAAVCIILLTTFLFQLVSQVERSLVLTKTGTVTVAAIRDAQRMKRAIKMSAMVNPETSKESS